jgi:uncharacterized membrane protein YebE (DUF533 family)
MDEATKYKAYLEGLKKATTKKSKFKSMAEMRAAKGFKPGETVSEFNKRRMMLGSVKQAAKASRYGKIAAGVAAAALAAKQYLNSKMEKEPEEKMYGGMMKKYKSGGLSPKQKKIARMAPPPDKITGEDFKAMKTMKAKSGAMVYVKTKIGKNKPTKIC